MSYVAPRTQRVKALQRGRANLVIGVYWSERAKAWDICVTANVDDNRSITKTTRAHTTVPVDATLADDAGTVIRSWLESLLF